MKVFEFIPEGVSDCTVTAWLHSHNESQVLQRGKRPAVIIIPGGGYFGVSDREAEPIAGKYFAAGYHTFVLYYSVKEKARNFQPLCQLASTVAHLRKYADVACGRKSDCCMWFLCRRTSGCISGHTL